MNVQRIKRSLALTLWANISQNFNLKRKETIKSLMCASWFARHFLIHCLIK